MQTFQHRHTPSGSYRRGLLAITVTLLFFVTGGCDGLSVVDDGDENSDFSEPVTFAELDARGIAVEQIERGQFADLVDGTRTILRDEEAYASFWTTLHADRSSVPERPAVDFTTHVVVAIVAGERPSGGYTVSVDEVMANESGDEILVRHTETVPGDDCAVTGALTSPYVLVVVEAQDQDVDFSGSESTRSC